MKKKLTTQERRKLISDFLNSDTGRDFVAWWKDHRHSGYATKGNQERWAIDPYKASRCDRYMAEYCSDRGFDQELRFEYTAADYERWAREQKEANDAVLKFAREHGGREIPTLDEFQRELKRAVAKLSAKFQV